MATPERIGRYEIIAELGRGGMATVFRALDPRFGREVAIKVLPPQFVDVDQFRQRFEREARTIAALEHPAIVPVYDFGDENGQPYLVMKLMSGGSLADRLESGPMTPQEVSRVLARIAGALDEAHRRGIVHRDLKPGNILFDTYGSAYLSDFGIVRLSESDSTLTGQHTIGTPGYMSPEQIQGEGLDGRSDIYALGVMLFQMLTGQLPYSAPTPAMVMVKHITEPVPDVRALNPSLPAGIGPLLSQTMAKNRAERPATAGDVARLLETAAAPSTAPPEAAPTTLSPTRPAAAAPVTPPLPPVPPAIAPTDAATDATEILTPDAAPAPAGRRSVPVWLLGLGGLLAVLAVVALAAGVLFFGGDDDDDDESGATAVVAVEEQAEEAERAQPTPNAAATRMAGAVLTQEAAEAAAGNAQAQARALVDEAWEALDAGRPTDVLALTNEAAELDPHNAAAWVVRGLALRDWLDQPRPAIDAFSRAIEIEPDNWTHYYDRAWTYETVEEHPAAHEDALRCAELAPEQAECALIVGVFSGRLGLIDQALAAFERAERLQPDWLEAILERAYLLESVGDLEPALVDFRRALALDPDDPWRYSDVMLLANQLGLHDEARDVGGDCTVRFPEHTECWLQLATAYRRLGQPVRAAGALEEAVASAADAETRYWLLMDVGYANLEAGNDLAARRAFERALEANPEGGDALLELAWLALSDGDDEAALDLARQAAAVDGRNPWVFYALANVHLTRDEIRDASVAYVRFLDLADREECPACVTEAEALLAEARRDAAGRAPGGIRTVSVPGSWNEEVGCAEAWLPACPEIELAPGDNGLWTGTFALPAGEWEVKVVINGGWEINFGVDGEPDGANIPFVLDEAGTVRFTFDPATWLLTIDGADG